MALAQAPSMIPEPTLNEIHSTFISTVSCKRWALGASQHSIMLPHPLVLVRVSIPVHMRELPGTWNNGDTSIPCAHDQRASSRALTTASGHHRPVAR